MTDEGGPASVFDINMRTRAELKVLQPREAPFEGLQSRVLPTDRVARIRGTKDQVQHRRFPLRCEKLFLSFRFS